MQDRTKELNSGFACSLKCRRLFAGCCYFLAALAPPSQEEIERLTVALRSDGHDDDAIRAYFDTEIKPDRTQRYFTAFMRMGLREL